MGATFAPDCLQGRIALITGASSGIGAAAARALAAAGASVVVSGRSSSKLDLVCRSIPNARQIVADLGAPGAAQKLAGAVGDVDILVNCAGYGEVRRTQKIDESSIDAMFAVNVRAPLILVAHLADGMSRRGHGAVINISSVVGSLGTPFQAVYAATKGAVDAATRSLAREFGRSGIRVNAIAPGMIATEMYGSRLENSAFVDSVADHINIGHWGDASMVADAIVFLASEAARYVTGEVLLVDGGLVRCGDIVPRAAMAMKRSVT